MREVMWTDLALALRRAKALSDADLPHHRQ